MIEASLRRYDAVGRYAPGEFLIVLPGCAPQNAFDVAERVRSHVSCQAILPSTACSTVTISVGVSSSAEDTVEFDNVIFAAGNALSRAKGAGRNRVEGPLHPVLVRRRTATNTGSPGNRSCDLAFSRRPRS